MGGLAKVAIVNSLVYTSSDLLHLGGVRAMIRTRFVAAVVGVLGLAAASLTGVATASGSVGDTDGVHTEMGAKSGADPRVITTAANAFNRPNPDAAIALAEAAAGVESIPMTQVGSKATTTLADGTEVVVDRAGEVLVDPPGMPALGVGLEGANGGTSILRGSVVSWGNGRSPHVVARSTADGAQLIAILEKSSDPERLTFRLKLNADSRAALRSDGSVIIRGSAPTGGDGSSRGRSESRYVIAKPWARDARGRSVPTHFEVGRSHITQVIEHSGSSYAYPILADPKISLGFPSVYVTYQHKETKFIAKYVDTKGFSWFSEKIVKGCKSARIASLICTRLVGKRIESLVKTFKQAASRPGDCVEVKYKFWPGTTQITASWKAIGKSRSCSG